MTSNIITPRNNGDFANNIGACFYFYTRNGRRVGQIIDTHQWLRAYYVIFKLVPRQAYREPIYMERAANLIGSKRFPLPPDFYKENVHKLKVLFSESISNLKDL